MPRPPRPPEPARRVNETARSMMPTPAPAPEEPHKPRPRLPGLPLENAEQPADVRVALRSEQDHQRREVLLFDDSGAATIERLPCDPRNEGRHGLGPDARGSARAGLGAAGCGLAGLGRHASRRSSVDRCLIPQGSASIEPGIGAKSRRPPLAKRRNQGPSGHLTKDGGSPLWPVSELRASSRVHGRVCRAHARRTRRGRSYSSLSGVVRISSAWRSAGTKREFGSLDSIISTDSR